MLLEQAIPEEVQRSLKKFNVAMIKNDLTLPNTCDCSLHYDVNKKLPKKNVRDFVNKKSNSCCFFSSPKKKIHCQRNTHHQNYLK